MGSKQRIWDVDFEAVEDVANRIMRKKLSSKKWQKNGVFYFYYCVLKFAAYKFFWVNFQLIQTQNQILHFMVLTSNFSQ